MVKLIFSPKGPRAGVLLVPLFEGQKEISGLPQLVRGALKNLIERGDFSGKKGEIVIEFVKSGEFPLRCLFTGLGKKGELTRENLKSAGGKALEAVSSLKPAKLSLWQIGEDKEFSLAEGVMLRNYLEAKRKTGPELEEAKKKLIKELEIIGELSAAEKKKIQRLAVIAAGVSWARDLTAMPPNELYPETLAQAAQKLGREFGLKVEVFGKERLRQLGMGLILAVGRGSSNEPKLIVLEWNPKGGRGAPIVLVGKGVTFDSGGYNIKPTGAMETMHTDMAGGAAVLGTLRVLAGLKIPRRVVGIIPAVENAVSDRSYKASEIIRSYSGQTVEITNTDAEGRLILADALTLAAERKPELIVDLATLTGACIVALGERYAGFFTESEKLRRSLVKASETSSEKLWELPLDETFKEKVKSKIADLRNLSPELQRNAGASMGAAFLSYFVKALPWAHIDIAGPSHQRNEIETWNPSTGYTGFGVRLLVELIEKSQVS